MPPFAAAAQRGAALLDAPALLLLAAGKSSSLKVRTPGGGPAGSDAAAGAGTCVFCLWPLSKLA